MKKIVRFDESCDEIKKICEEVVVSSTDPCWQAEIARLPSGVVGFIFMAVEDAVSDFGTIHGREVGDELVISFENY